MLTLRLNLVMQFTMQKSNKLRPKLQQKNQLKVRFLLSYIRLGKQITSPKVKEILKKREKSRNKINLLIKVTPNE
jgi:hypothetical protein